MCKYRELEKEVYGRLRGNDAVRLHAPERYQELLQKLKVTERERLDILHMLELSDDLGEEQYQELAKELQKVVRKRRKVKDEIMYYKVLIGLLKGNTKITYRLIRANLAGVTKTLKERVYHVRERNDMKSYFNDTIKGKM